MLRLVEVVCVIGLMVSLFMLSPWALLAAVSAAGLVAVDRVEK